MDADVLLMWMWMWMWMLLACVFCVFVVVLMNVSVCVVCVMRCRQACFAVDWVVRLVTRYRTGTNALDFPLPVTSVLRPAMLVSRGGVFICGVGSCVWLCGFGKVQSLALVDDGCQRGQVLAQWYRLRV